MKVLTTSHTVDFSLCRTQTVQYSQVQRGGRQEVKDGQVEAKIARFVLYLYGVLITRSLKTKAYLFLLLQGPRRPSCRRERPHGLQPPIPKRLQLIPGGLLLHIPRRLTCRRRPHLHAINALFLLHNLPDLILLRAAQHDHRAPIRPVPAMLAVLVP